MPKTKIQDFKLAYNGKDKFMKYFADHQSEEWGFQNFQDHFTSNRKIRDATMIKTYKQSIHHYLKRKTLSDELRNTLVKLLQESPQSPLDNKPANTSTYNIEYKISGDSRPVIFQNSTNNGDIIIPRSSTPINQDDNNDENQDESFDTQDYTPNATTKTYMVRHDDDDDEQIDDNDKWLFGEVNLTDFLVDYRKEALYLNDHCTDRELSPARLLALSHVYLFPPKSSTSCLKDLPNTLLSIIYANLNTLQQHPQLPAKVTSIACDMIDAYSSGDETSMFLKTAGIVIKAGEDQENRDILVKAASTLMDVTKQIQRYTSGPFQEKLHNEDTFIKQFLCPWIDNIFNGDMSGVIWASAKLAETSDKDPLKMYPDFTMYTVVNSLRYDLFVIEVKPPHHSHYLLDQRKIGYQMQTMLNKLVDLKVPSPMVCGMWVDGDSCHTYTMDLEFNGIYRMIEVGNFTLPKGLEDVAKARHILDILFKLKAVCQDTAEKIDITVKARKTQQNMISNHSPPRMSWKRVGEYEHITVPKKPKV